MGQVAEGAVAVAARIQGLVLVSSMVTTKSGKLNG